MHQLSESGWVMPRVDSILLLKPADCRAISDFPCPQQTDQTFPVEPVSADGFVIGVGEAR